MDTSKATLDRSLSASSLARKPSVGEDPLAMTIEFLRARLLSERSVSKAARERAEHLTKKVTELEHRLEQEIQLRKSVESARLEALSKYREELITDYGYFFVSNSGEEDGEGFLQEDGESFVQSSGLEDEKGSSMDRTDNKEDSSMHLDCGQDQNEGIMNDDEEAEQMGREKGILAWGRRRGMRKLQDKEWGLITDRFGRNFSQKSFSAASADGESPQKKWVGKSVRQIRKKENRAQDTNSEEGSVQTHEAEDGELKSGDQGLQCDEERDTEVERVLEHQAELIGQFEAEENAQRAWEEKFRERDSIGNGQVEERSWLKESAAKPMKADEHQSTQLSEDVAATQPFEKTQVDDYHSEGSDMERSTSSRIFPSTILEDSNRGVKNESSLDTINEVSPESDAFQGDNGSLLVRDEAQQRNRSRGVRQSGTVEEADDQKTNEIAGLSASESDAYDNSQGQNLPHNDTQLIQGTPSNSDENQSLSNTAETIRQVNDSNMDNEVGEQQMAGSSAKLEGINKLALHNKQLSSSFKFNVYMDSLSPNLIMPREDVASTSHQPLDLPTAHVDDQNNSSYIKISNEQVKLVPSSTEISGRSTMKIIQNSSAEHVAPFNEDRARMVVNERAHPLGEVHPRAVPHGDFSFGMTRPNDWRGSRDQGRGAYWVGESSQKRGENGFTENHQNLQVSGAASGVERPRSEGSDKSNVSREAMADVGEVIARRSNTQSPMEDEDGLIYAKASHASSDNLMSDSSREDVNLRRTRTQEQPKIPYRYAPHASNLQMQYHRHGIKFDIPPSTTRPDYSDPHRGYGNVAHGNQNTGFRNHRESVEGGFDRVMEVLRALQIAKHQVESSDEEANLAGDFDGYNFGRSRFYMEKPPPPPHHPPPPPPPHHPHNHNHPHASYPTPFPPIPQFTMGPQYNMGGAAPYQWSHSPVMKPVIPELFRTGAPGAGYASSSSSSSRQPSDLQYAVRMAQTHPVQYHHQAPWSPPYGYNSNITHRQDASRQHR